MVLVFSDFVKVVMHVFISRVLTKNTADQNAVHQLKPLQTLSYALYQFWWKRFGG